jgi:hypothetical protein
MFHIVARRWVNPLKQDAIKRYENNIVQSLSDKKQNKNGSSGLLLNP